MSDRTGRAVGSLGPSLVGRRNNPLRDLAGLKSGKLTALRATSERRHNGVVWECQCECGNTFKAWSRQLVRGKVKSCGCIPRGAQPTHRLSKAPEYGTWNMMKHRCYNPETRWIMKELAAAMGLEESLVRFRVKKGMTLEQAARSAALRFVA